MLARGVTQGLRMTEGGEEGGIGTVGWMVEQRDKLTVWELSAMCSHSRDAFVSPSLLGCLDPLLVPKWSCLESSV